jgi:hypothetical protein
MTGLDVISSAMRLIGALASGETPTAAEANDALVCANDMFDSWQAERLMVFSIQIQEYPLAPSKQVYTYGPGGDFNAVRPAKVDRVSVVSLTNPSQPLEIPIPYFTDWDWQSQPVKTGISTTLPLGVYDDGNYPLRNISVQYTPNTVSNLRFYVWQALNSFPDLVTDVAFPPGYREALRYNLAVRLIAEMPGEYASITVADVQQLAVDSLARVKSMNMPIIQAFCDPALTGRGGWYNGFADNIWGQR